jgi:hypothetical protein
MQSQNDVGAMPLKPGFVKGSETVLPPSEGMQTPPAGPVTVTVKAVAFFGSATSWQSEAPVMAQGAEKFAPIAGAVLQVPETVARTVLPGATVTP